MTMSIMRLAIGLVPVTLARDRGFSASICGDLGLALVAFFCQSDADQLGDRPLRLGAGAAQRPRGGEHRLVDHVPLMPLACVYYPVAVLPDWLQCFAWSLPPTYVFEGMRAAIVDHVFRADLMLEALAINAGLLAAGGATFLALLRSARKAGSLLQMGE